MLVGFALFSWSNLQAQVELESDASLSEKYGSLISSKELNAHLSIIASDGFEGRETGTEGQRKAAAYLVEKIKAYGLDPLPGEVGYEQEIAFTKERWSSINANGMNKTFKHLWDFCSFPATNTSIEASFDEVVFLGYGIQDEKYNDYADVDVKGKLLMVYDSEPTNSNGVSYITGSTDLSDWSTDFRKKFRIAKENGAAAILIIDRDIKNRISTNRNRMLNGRFSFGKGEDAATNYAANLFISSTMAKDLLGKKGKKVIKARKKISKSGKPVSLKIRTDLNLNFEKETRTLIGSNVGGMIVGSDPVLKDEYVFVTAHYDHLGKRAESIYNGADDNGSGTSTILEVAQSFAIAKAAGNGPKRSVVFIWVSGEEKGLLGSAYYVNDPIISLDQTIVDINVDMVGRVDEKYENNPEYIYVIGADKLSQDLHDINEAVNSNFNNLTLDYTYNDENDPNRYYYRSDHYNFAKNNIPVIFYFNGVHEDYHKTTDTVEKIDFKKIQKISRLVFLTAWELANRDEAPALDKK